jgi:hypothetical protein
MNKESIKREKPFPRERSCNRNRIQEEVNEL